MPSIAHIGNIPVEEWLPFVVPVVAIYFNLRRNERRRRERVRRLLETAGPLDAKITSAVVANWAASDHGEVSPEHIPLLYPPGPDGKTVSELARQVHRDAATVARQLEELADLGYLEVDDGEDDPDARQGWLTAEGCSLVNLAEDALLVAVPPDAEARARRSPDS